jgi:hypothetical protein
MFEKAGIFMMSPQRKKAKDRMVSLPVPVRIQEELEEDFKLVGMMRIVGEQFRKKLLKFLAEAASDKHGRAEWFAKRNEKERAEKLREELEALVAMTCNKTNEEGKEIPAFNFDYAFYNYFKEREKQL